MDHQPGIVRMDNISKNYRLKGSLFGDAKDRKIVALNKIDLTILKGDIFGLVGESGSGKTTAGRLLVKLEKPNQGRLYFNGQDLSQIKGRGLRQFRRDAQMIFQDPYQSLNPHVSIFNTVAEPLIVQKIGGLPERLADVKAALADVGLPTSNTFLQRYPHQLSGGERQRVAISRAMILKPRFVVADEPTSMLDATISFQIFNILLALKNKLNLTLLFITHHLAAAQYLCNRLAVIYRGHIVEKGPAKTVINHPKHPYTQDLIDALPSFGGIRKKKPFHTLLKEERIAPKSPCCPYFTKCNLGHQEDCTQSKPPLIEVGHDHLAACVYV